MPVYELSGRFEDGGSFTARLVPPNESVDRCPIEGIGCFAFDEAMLSGEYAIGAISASARIDEVNSFSSLDYQLRSNGDVGDTILFLFGAIQATLPEWLLSVRFEYMTEEPIDRPWDGKAARVGSFMGGSIGNDRGYNSPITEATLTILVPEPTSAGIFAALLGLSAIPGRNNPW